MDMRGTHIYASTSEQEHPLLYMNPRHTSRHLHSTPAEHYHMLYNSLPAEHYHMLFNSPVPLPTLVTDPTYIPTSPPLGYATPNRITS